MNKLAFTDFREFLNSVEEFTQEKLLQVKFLLENEGMEIESIDDLWINSDDVLFTLLPDGTLQRVNLYIAEQIVNQYKPLLEPDYKYHIYICNTLSKMFNHHRKHRYKINTRNDGTFYYLYIDYHGHIIKEKENERLRLCLNCLRKYYTEKGVRVNYLTEKDAWQFDLKKFHEEHKYFYEFNINDFELPQGLIPNVYPKNWSVIAKKYKEKQNWICEKCGWRPAKQEERRFLHLHHKNGDKRNNFSTNLQVLCIKCHANIDSFHGRIKNNSDYREFLKLKK